MEKNQLLLMSILISLVSLVTTMANPSIPTNYFDPTTDDPAPAPAPAPQLDVADPNVKSVCDKTEDPPLCVSSVLPHLNGETDPASILATCINISILANEVAAQEIKALSKGPTPPSRKCYKGCLENFESAIDDLKEALDMLQERNAHRVSTRISSGFHAAIECEDDFQDSPGTDGLIAQMAGSLKNVSGICIDIAGTAQLF